jgi:hypothetical protein
MNLILLGHILIVFVILSALWYLVKLIPESVLNATLKQVFQVIVIVAAVIYIINLLIGLMSGHIVDPFHF